MTRCEVGVIAGFLTELQQKVTEWEERQENGKLPERDVISLRETINTLRGECRDLKLFGPRTALTTTARWLSDGNCTYFAGISELRHVLAAMQDELCAHYFFVIKPGREKYYSRNDLFGKPVSQAFPSAISDITEAGNCLAFDRNTASVFHLMRTVEWGIRALCAHLGLRKAKSKIKRSGKAVYAPIEYSEWEKLLDGLQDKVDAKMSKLKRGPSKQSLQEFYYPILQDLRGIRDAWRNHVMHTRAEYGDREAEAIFEHVRRIMVTLSTKVAEV